MNMVKAAMAFVLAVAVAPAWAGPLLGTAVHGEMLIGGINYFDPARGFVSATYGNASQGTNVVAADPGIEFGYLDGVNTITADFTADRLFLTDLSAGDGTAIRYRFTALTPGAFGMVSLLSNSLPGMTWTFEDDVLTIDVAKINLGAAGTYQAAFAIGPAAVPEPAAWAMMLAGFGAVGGAMRARRRAVRLARAA